MNAKETKFLAFCAAGLLCIGATYLISLYLLAPTFFPLLASNLPEKISEATQAIWTFSMGGSLILTATTIPLVFIFQRKKMSHDTKKTTAFLYGAGILIVIAGCVLIGSSTKTESALHLWKYGGKVEGFLLNIPNPSPNDPAKIIVNNEKIQFPILLTRESAERLLKTGVK